MRQATPRPHRSGFSAARAAHRALSAAAAAPRRVAVTLAARDQIVDAPEVRAYLTTDADAPPGRAVPGEDADVETWRAEDGLLEVLWYPKLDHAQVFDTARSRRPMVDVLERFVESTVV